MPREQLEPLLPALTPDELRRRDEQETILDRQLRACSRGDGFDIERGFQAMRAYVIEIFEVIHTAYRRKAGYQAAWFPRIIDEAIHRVLITSDQHLRYERINSKVLADLLEKTLLDHHRGGTSKATSADVDREWEESLRHPPIHPKPPLPPAIQAQMESQRDEKTWSPLHQRVAALEEIRKLMKGPKVEIPEMLVRETLAEQLGIKPEDVTWKQIQFEVSGLLKWYPAICLIPASANPQSCGPSDQTAQLAKEPNIGVELKRLLEEARIRPEDIAEEIGIDARNVYRHIAGKNQPSLVNIGQYEKAFSKRLGRKIALPTPAKRQNVSKTSEKGQ
jgi:hypothetical protein